MADQPTLPIQPGAPTELPGTAEASPEVQALATSANPALDLVSGFLGRHANPQNGAINLVNDTPLDGNPPPFQPQPVPPQMVPPQQAPQPVSQQAPQQVPVADIASRYTDTPPPPTAQPIPDLPPEQNIELPQNPLEQDKAHQAFARSRAEAKQLRQLAEGYRKQLEEQASLQKKWEEEQKALNDKLNAEQARAIKLEEDLGKTNLEQSPAFIERYDRPLAGIRDEMAEQIKALGIDQNEALDFADRIITAENPDAANQVMGDLDPMAKGKLAYLFEQAAGIYRDRTAALTDWRQSKAGLDEAYKQELALQNADVLREQADVGLQRVARVIPFWNDPNYVTERDQQIPTIKSWFARATPDQIAAAAMEGAIAAPYAYKQIERLQQENADLRMRLEGRYRMAAPPVSPMYQPPAPPAPRPAPVQPAPDANANDPVSIAAAMVRQVARGSGFGFR